MRAHGRLDREAERPCKGAKVWKGVGVGVVKSEARDSGGGKVGLTILGRSSGRAGMLEPTHIRYWRLAVGGWERKRGIGS